MSDSFYHITESIDLNFCVEIHRYSALTYDVMKSKLTSVRDKKIRNGCITLETRVIM